MDEPSSSLFVVTASFMDILVVSSNQCITGVISGIDCQLVRLVASMHRMSHSFFLYVYYIISWTFGVDWRVVHRYLRNFSIPISSERCDNLSLFFSQSFIN